MKLTLLNHIGIFLIIAIISNLICLTTQDDQIKCYFNKEDWYIPTAVALMFLLIFEAFYWIFKIFF